MAHKRDEISSLKDKLALLEADQAAETAAKAEKPPKDIPPNWLPVIYHRGQADYVIVGWIDPGYRVSVYPGADNAS